MFPISNLKITSIIILISVSAHAQKVAPRSLFGALWVATHSLYKTFLTDLERLTSEKTDLEEQLILSEAEQERLAQVKQELRQESHNIHQRKLVKAGVSDHADLVGSSDGIEAKSSPVFELASGPLGSDTPAMLLIPGGSGGGGNPPSSTGSSNSAPIPTIIPVFTNPNPDEFYLKLIQLRISICHSNQDQGIKNNLLQNMSALTQTDPAFLKKYGLLHLACICGHLDVVKALVEAGSDINLLYNQQAAQGIPPTTDSEHTPAHVAIVNQRLDILEYLASQSQFNPNAVSTEQSSLFAYSMRYPNGSDLVQVILNHPQFQIPVENTNDNPLLFHCLQALQATKMLQRHTQKEISTHLDLWLKYLSAWILLKKVSEIKQLIHLEPALLTTASEGTYFIHKLLIVYKKPSRNKDNLLDLLKEILKINPEQGHIVLDTAIKQELTEFTHILISHGKIPLETLLAYFEQPKVNSEIKKLISKYHLYDLETLKRSQLETASNIAWTELSQFESSDQKRTLLIQQEQEKARQDEEARQKRIEEQQLEENAKRFEREQAEARYFLDAPKEIPAKEKKRLAQEQQILARKKRLQEEEEAQEALAKQQAAAQERLNQIHQQTLQAHLKTFKNFSEEFETQLLPSYQAQKESFLEPALEEQRRLFDLGREQLRAVLQATQNIPELVNCPPLYAAVYQNNRYAIQHILRNVLEFPTVYYFNQDHSPLALAIRRNESQAAIRTLLVDPANCLRPFAKELLLTACIEENGLYYFPVFYAVKLKKLVALKILVELLQISDIKADQLWLENENLLEFAKGLFGEKPKKDSEESRILKLIHTWTLGL